MPRARSQEPIPPSVPQMTREARVEQLLVSGHRTGQVVAMIATEFDVSERTVLDDVATVRDRWAKESADERPRVRAEMLAQVEDLYRQCRADNDHKVAVATLQLKADLHGLRVRPMAALVAPDAKPKDIDTWLSGVLGFGAKVPEDDDPTPSR